MNKTVSLHLGVHKTASTYLQDSMDLNRDMIVENKADYIDLDLLRTHHRLAGSLNGEKAQEEINKILEEILCNEKSDRVIISDENILGYSSHWNGCSMIYPKADGNLRALEEALKGHTVEVYIGIRNMSTFLPSIYCEYLRSLSSLPNTFEEFIVNLNLETCSWLGFLRRVEKIFSRSQIRIWDYEIMRNDASVESIIRKICGFQDAPEIKLKKNISRPSINSKGIELLQNTSKDLNWRLWKSLRESMTFHPEWTKGKKYCPWKPLELSFLNNQHKNNLKQLKGPQFELLS